MTPPSPPATCSAPPPTSPPNASSATAPPRPPTSTPSASSSTSCWQATAPSKPAPRSSSPWPTSTPPRPPRTGRPLGPAVPGRRLLPRHGQGPSARPPSAAAFASLVRAAPGSRPPRHPPAPASGRGGPGVPAPPLRPGAAGPRPRRRGLLVALLLAGALLAALPALAGGLPLVRERVEGPLAVLDPGSAVPERSSAGALGHRRDARPGCPARRRPGPAGVHDPGAGDDRRVRQRRRRPRPGRRLERLGPVRRRHSGGGGSSGAGSRARLSRPPAAGLGAAGGQVTSWRAPVCTS